MKHNIDIIIFLRRCNTCLNFAVSVSSLIIIVSALIIITGGALFFLIHNANVSIAGAKLVQAEQENRNLLNRISLIKSKLVGLSKRTGFQIAEDNRQRSFLQVAQIAPDIWAMGTGGRKISLNSGISSSTAMTLEEVYNSIDRIKGQLNLRQKSLQEINSELNKNYDLWRHIPSINPVPGTTIGSGFGYRIDPIDKTVRMHEGVDLGAQEGTPIMASADGIVTFADWNMGYGYVVDIDHGYGFLSRYAHCSKILVQVGDFVKRGQIIALVGRTGRTTCPHLHYEVHISGIKVNPANYIHFKDIVFD
uniref:M23 family metallopeptidase n=1 Tax=candidate division WOR-3 bacterium TaxID=2052148 RepID=A0A7C4TAN7_UNCW3